MTVMLRVRTVMTGWAGGPGLNTVYWRPGTGGGSTADATDCAARVRAALNAIAGVFPSSVTLLTSPTCDAIEDTTGALVGTFTGAVPALVAGSGGAIVTAPATAILVRQDTGVVVNGKRLRGRWFISPLDANAVNSSGEANATDRATINTAFNAMLVGGGTLSFPVVWHRPGPLGAGTSAPIVLASCNTTLAVLRSRRD